MVCTKKLIFLLTGKYSIKYNLIIDFVQLWLVELQLMTVLKKL